MIELSIEQKAKAYDEALERYKAKQDYESKEVHKFIEYIFPELKESDDETIRKDILTAVKEAEDSLYVIMTPQKQKRWIDWLEKQGDKVDAIEGFSTEFERQVSGLIASAINREHEYNKGFVKWNANALLNYAKHELEKQGKQMPDPRYSILDKLIEADDIYQMSVNDAMVEEAKNKAIEVLSKLEISKLLWLEKQGE